MNLSEREIYFETLNAPKGGFILSGDSYIIEEPGWYQVVSPSRPDASKNEVIFSEIPTGQVKDKINQVIEFYKNLGTSFKWCTNPETKPNTLPDTLRKLGFQSWFSRGMYCNPNEVHIESDVDVQIEKVSLSNLDEYLDLFIEGWDMDLILRPLLREDYEWALSQTDRRFNYFMVKSDGLSLGTAGYINKGKSAYLVGGNILPKYRGRGFYKALVKKRLDLIKNHGIPLATTGARDHTSAPILEKFGFKTVYRSEIFQFDLPE